MRRLVLDWRGLYERERGIRPLRGREMRRCAACDSLEINSVPAHAHPPLSRLHSDTRVQLLKHVAGRPYRTTQGWGAHPRGSHIRVASMKAASALRVCGSSV